MCSDNDHQWLGNFHKFHAKSAKFLNWVILSVVRHMVAQCHVSGNNKKKVEARLFVYFSIDYDNRVGIKCSKISQIIFFPETMSRDYISTVAAVRQLHILSGVKRKLLTRLKGDSNDVMFNPDLYTHINDTDVDTINSEQNSDDSIDLAQKIFLADACMCHVIDKNNLFQLNEDSQFQMDNENSYVSDMTLIDSSMDSSNFSTFAINNYSQQSQAEFHPPIQLLQVSQFTNLKRKQSSSFESIPNQISTPITNNNKRHQLKPIQQFDYILSSSAGNFISSDDPFEDTKQSNVVNLELTGCSPPQKLLAPTFPIFSSEAISEIVHRSFDPIIESDV